jgi:hypothetical protein
VEKGKIIKGIIGKVMEPEGFVYDKDTVAPVFIRSL